MNYPFASEKATQVAALFIQKEGGTINIMKLIKLVYLLDRLSLSRRGVPALGGDYFSMKNGPVTSELLDLINSGWISGMETDWEQYISDRAEHQVALDRDPGCDQLSQSEIDMICEIYVQHGKKDAFALRAWCHSHLPEWHPITAGRKQISVESILEALGKSDEEIKQTVQEAQEIESLEAMLA